MCMCLLWRKRIRRRERQRDKNCQVIHHAGQRTLCHLFFYFLSIFCSFWFDFPFRRHKKKKRTRDSRWWSDLLIFGHFYLFWFGSSSFLFFERLDIASYRLSLQISERENVQFHWVISIDLFAIRNGFLIRFWFDFFFFTFVKCPFFHDWTQALINRLAE